jgi:hypothetical protein
VEGKIGKWRNDLSLGKILDGAIRTIGEFKEIGYSGRKITFEIGTNTDIRRHLAEAAKCVW